jgi:transcriptional regulator with XRE-family HTH domain
MSNSLKGRIIPLEHKSILLSNLNNGGGRYRFTKGHIPWNKDLKGMLPFKPNTKLTKIPWANDQKLTELATQHGLTATAKMFGTTSSLLHARLKSRGITIIRSKINLGTFTNGSNHKMSILKEEQVLEIVKLYHSGNYSQQELGDQFGVSRLTISGITNGQNWSHLTKIQPGQPKFRRSGFRTGSKHHMAILNDKQVLEIIKLIADKNYTYAEIGKQFGVKRNSIKNIACGKAWSHLTGIIPKTKKKSP